MYTNKIKDSKFYFSSCLASSLFQDMKLKESAGFLKPLPWKLQQRAFENLYVKFQEGIQKLVIQYGSNHATATAFSILGAILVSWTNDFILSNPFFSLTYV